MNLISLFKPIDAGETLNLIYYEDLKTIQREFNLIKLMDFKSERFKKSFQRRQESVHVGQK